MIDRPTVLVDMDGVLADFDGATATYLQTADVNIPLRPRNNFYYREDYLDPAHVDVIDKLHAPQNFFRNLPPIEGAIEGWHRLEELGYALRICSSPLHTNEWCKDEKLAWIEEHLGRAAVDTAIIDPRKELYQSIALIDDRPDVKNAENATWQHIVFDTSYNQRSPASLRLNGWNDPALPDLLEYCLQRYHSRR